MYLLVAIMPKKKWGGGGGGYVGSSFPVDILLTLHNLFIKYSWGAISKHIRVKHDPEIGQLCADLTNNGDRLTQLWVIFRVRLTDFRVIVDPEWSLAPMDPFRVKFDPGVFRV